MHAHSIHTTRIGRRAVVSLVAALMALAAFGVAPGQAGDRVDIIAVFNDSVRDPGAAAADVARANNGEITSVYGTALRGFAGNFPAGRVEGLRHDPRIFSVEFDQVATITAQSVPTGIDRIAGDLTGAAGDYSGIDIAIIDTGIDLDHEDLNVVRGVDCTSGTCVAGGNDVDGHGTHVAGTAAAIDNDKGVIGVAPGASLHAVKVLLDGSGQFSWIIAGIDWVAAQGDIEVANMSLGCYRCGTITALDTALDNAVAGGVTFAVAAGNDGGDASNAIPANNGSVITVSALWDTDGAAGGGNCRTYVGGGPKFTQCDDDLAYFSNWGDPVDIVAPGYRILSTVPDNGYDGTYSGTSMASPHVAGAAARLIHDGLTGGPSAVKAALLNAGSFDWVDTSGDGVQEPLLFFGTVTPPPPPVNQAPTADFTADCTELSCQFTNTSTDPAGDGDGDGALSSTWDFGDLSSGSTATSPSHAYGAYGSYDVTLTVSDGELSDSVTRRVTLSEPPPPGSISLTVSPDKIKGKHAPTLSWTGATDTSVDIIKDGGFLTSTANDGSYQDVMPSRGGTSFTYQVCDSGGCSNTVTVVY